MSVETIKELLVLIAPSLSAIATIIGGIVYFARSSKKSADKSRKETSKEVSNLSSTQAKQQKDIAIIKTKVTSIENYLLEQKEKK